MRRFICVVVAVVMSIGFLGCSGKSPATDVKEKNSVTEIAWWTFPSFSQEKGDDLSGCYEQKLIDEFEKKHKDIRIKLNVIDFATGPEKLEYAIKNNAVCDVLFDAPGRIISYGKRNLLVSLDDLFTEEFEKDVNSKELLDACKINGKPYMYPLSSAPFYMAFNKE